MKKKKEIEIPKNKYIYQKYDGIITKYIIDNEYYINTQTGIASKKDTTLLLGTVSKNIIDLIEVGDIVFIQDVLNNDFIYIYDNEMLKAVREDIEGGLQITQVLTREQFEANAYKIDIN